MSKEKETSPPVETKFNPALPTAFIDHIHLGIREDDMCLLRFLTGLPEGIIEQSRIMTSKEHLKGFVDVLCANLDHYPIKTKKLPKSKK